LLRSSTRPALAEPVQLRWQAFEGIRVALEKLHGPLALERLRPRLSPEVASVVTFRTDTRRAWYPVAWYAELHDAAQAEFGGGRRLHREIGRLATEHDLRTVHRFILQFVSPRAILTQSQRIWGLYSDRGIVTHEPLAPNRVRVRFTECPGVSLPVWEDIASSTAAILAAAGARSVTHTLVSASTELGTCVAQYEWAT
jgi:hypothetical protein